MSDNIFTKIINREIKSDIVYEDELSIVIKDINPKARIHYLVIPKKPIATLFDLAAEDKDLMGHLIFLLPKLAKQANVEGFKTVIHTGVTGGQEVFHIHIHLLAD